MTLSVVTVKQSFSMKQITTLAGIRRKLLILLKCRLIPRKIKETICSLKNPYQIK